MTDANGKVVWRADELPFGKEYTKQEISTKNSRRYLGKELDKETGLISMGARYLDPKTGRFNRPDPVQLVDPHTGKINQEMLLNPQRQNRYAYALNNPYRYADPDGEFAIVIAYASYIAASALAVGIFHYGAPIAADIGKKLHNKKPGVRSCIVHGSYTARISNDATAQHYTYDPAGNLSAKINRRGNQVTYSVNANGQVTGVDYSSGAPVTYTYNPIGQLVSMTDGQGTTSIQYTANHLVERIDYPGSRFLSYT